MEEIIIQNDFYLKMASEADMPSVLAAFYKQEYTTMVDDETGEETQVPQGEPYLVQYSADYAIDVVGKVMSLTGNMVMDDDGNTYPEMAPVPGWHINIRLSGDNRRADVEALSDYFVNPEPVTPYRIWL